MTPEELLQRLEDPPLTLQHMRVFEAVVRLGHLNLVAEEFGKSTSQITRLIQQLEEAVGEPVLDRSRGGAKLTVAGALLLPLMREALENAGQVLQAIHDLKSGEAGLLRVAMVPAAVFAGTGLDIASVRKRIPRLRVEMESIEGPFDFDRLRQDLDAAYIFPPAPDAWRSMRRARMDWSVAVASEDALATRYEIGPEELAGRQLIMPPQVRWKPQHAVLVDLMRQEGHEPKIDMRVSDDLVRFALVSVGMGIALVPSCFAADGVPNVTFRPLRPNTLPPIELRLVWDGENQNPALLALIEAAEADTIG